MASAQSGNRLRVIDKRLSTSLGTDANFKDISAMRTRLAAISGTTFTAARLEAMTKNDMVYALRANDEAAGLNV